MERALSDKEKLMGQLALSAYRGILTFEGKVQYPEPLSDSTQRYLHDDLTKYLQKDLNLADYEVFWGPAIMYPPKNVGNAPIAYMFIAKSFKDSEFTVVIRGTDPISIYSWLVEDLDIDSERQVPWNTVVGINTGIDNECKVSNAANNATQIHSELQAWSWYYSQNSKTLSSTNYTFVNYLKDNVIAYKSDFDKSEKIKLNFCGHSLGGLLASTFAQWFHDSQKELANEFDINIYAIACPTAGNSAFAQRVEGTFYNSLGVYLNECDGAAHAWNDMQDYIKTLQEKADTTSAELERFELQEVPKSSRDLQQAANSMLKSNIYADTLASMYAQLKPVTNIPTQQMKYQMEKGNPKVSDKTGEKIQWIIHYCVFQHIVPYAIAFQDEICSAEALLSPFKDFDLLTNEIKNLG